MRSWRKSEVGSLTRLCAWLVVKLRWFVVLGWAAGLLAAAVWLPATVPNADLGGFAPPNSRAIATETASAKAFGFPVLSRTMLVQRDEQGLSAGRYTGPARRNARSPSAHIARRDRRSGRAPPGRPPALSAAPA